MSGSVAVTHELDRAGAISVRMVERMAFYDYTPSVYAVVITGETALYDNLILKKGVL